MPQQTEWRFCKKCTAMFWDGEQDKGRCAGGDTHAAAGYNFSLPYDEAGTATVQTGWRFCGKCTAMFWDGEQDKGRCAGGDAHAAAGYNFSLPHECRDKPEPRTPGVFAATAELFSTMATQKRGGAPPAVVTPQRATTSYSLALRTTAIPFPTETTS
ncbi:hypothetical protein ABZV24_30450 [Streptomyces sp. NPDC005251]|uniref:hypothetical protein n=1 Tax=Streptomyces sp. NPDC005251 TaxID=3157166 RepID=UPI0033B5F0B1